MIDYNPESCCDVVCRWKGSVLPLIWWQVLLVVIISTGLATWNEHFATLNATDGLYPILVDESGWALMGFFVAFLLVFRNATCVHRYNAGRTHLTKMVVGSVELVRKTSNFYVGADEIPDMAARSHGGKEVMAAEQVNRDLAAVAVSLRREVLCIMAFLMADLRGQALTGEDKDHDWMKAQELVSCG